MKKFSDFLDIDVSTIETLTLAHTTQSIYGIENIFSKELDIRRCDTLKDDLLYTFYGKPEYKSNINVNVNIDDYSKICFILNAEYFKDFNRIYPFDSGAFINKTKFKKKYFHESINIDQFQLEGNILNAKKIVKTFYSDNENYINNKSQLSKDVPSIDFVIKGYVRVIQDKTNTPLDNRKNTIEVIHDKKIPLNRDSVKQIIMPNMYLDNADLMKIIKNEFNITKPLTYRLSSGNPSHYWGVINEKYLEFNTK